MDAVCEAYKSAAERMPGVLLGDFRVYAEQCEITPVMIGERCAGAVIVDGPEIHACVQGWAKGLWFKRSHIRLLLDVVRRHGYAYTSATTEDGVDFVSRLGFVRDGDRWVMYGH